MTKSRQAFSHRSLEIETGHLLVKSGQRCAASQNEHRRESAGLVSLLVAIRREKPLAVLPVRNHNLDLASQRVDQRMIKYSNVRFGFGFSPVDEVGFAGS
jgi:hypothetical protein